MNKLLKGSIAGAAGIALLLGGAGTLAYWNDSATMTNAGTITAGKLDVVPGTGTTAGKWTVQNGAAAPVALTDVAAYRIVPGNTLVYTETLAVDAIGDNLKFGLASTVPALTNGITGSTVTSNFTVKKAGTVVTTTTPNTYTNLTAGTYTVEAVITVTFPDTVSGQVGQGQSVSLAGATVTVTQIA